MVAVMNGGPTVMGEVLEGDGELRGEVQLLWRSAFLVISAQRYTPYRSEI